MDTMRRNAGIQLLVQSKNNAAPGAGLTAARLLQFSL
jgi:hypothetical protein